MICDSHIHVGQYYEMYTSPEDVLTFVESVGLDMVAVSSTNTCEENYLKVIEDMHKLRTLLKNRLISILWVTPKLLTNPILCNKVLSCGIDWHCVKIHPQLNPEFGKIDLPYTNIALSICQKIGSPILIHTGVVAGCHPISFESYYDNYPSQIFVLAHGRPIDETLQMLKKYDNIFVDTAFMPISHIRTLVDNGFDNRILWGSDYPIFKYFEPSINQDDYYKQILHELSTLCTESTYTKITQSNFRHIFSSSIMNKRRKYQHESISGAIT